MITMWIMMTANMCGAFAVSQSLRQRALQHREVGAINTLTFQMRNPAQRG